MQLVVGTRGSQLALIQTGEVLADLKLMANPPTVKVAKIRSTGDQAPDTPLSRLGKGIFIKELESALLDGTIDIAVHSLKDLPVELAEGLSIVVIGRRRDPRDVLVSKTRQSLSDMPPGSIIGTSSARRLVQLRAMRSDLDVKPIRGNVETRLRKAQGPDYDGVVVAAAGLARLGLSDQATQYFDPFEMIPEPGQGALAVEIRSEDKDLMEMLHKLEDSSTSAATIAERVFVLRLGGGCRLPMAAYASVQGDILTVVGMVASEDGSQILKEQLEHSVGDPIAAGHALADRLLFLGASDLLKAEAES
ncbi:MAG: hydroxymethylbilane synthase [Chloroflexi bacterium]|nr:hydroxymethylbilane synthase [Chloroflexota bacterium]